MPRKQHYSTKPNLSKYDNEVMEIIGDKGATFDYINRTLRNRGTRVSCLETLLGRLVATGFLQEDTICLSYTKSTLAPKIRRCLGCGKLFESSWKGNRQCGNCAGRQD